MAKQKPLKERRKEAEQLVAEINSELEKAQSAVESCLAELKEASQAKTEFQKLSPTIRRISKNVNSALSKIRSDRDNLSKLLTTVNSFYNKKYLPLETKINDPETGLKARIKQGQNFERELRSVKENYQRQIKLIKDLVDQSRTKLNELKKIDTALRQIELKVVANEKSTNEQKLKIDDAAAKVDLATKNILESEKTIKEKVKEIEELTRASNDAYSQIVGWNATAEETLGKIQRIYEIAAETGLGGEFDKRRKILDTELKRWSIHLIISTILLFLIIIGLFVLQMIPETVNWDVSKLTLDTNFYVRFLLTSPIIYYLVFVTNHYNKTKRLLEKYSFKTALALSIEAHINLLTNIEILKQDEYLGQITTFIIDGFNKIYFEPYQKEEPQKTKPVLEEILSTLKLMRKE